MTERLRRWTDEDWAWVRQEIADAEESRDNQWASGDRAFAERNDARAAALRELVKP